jgi:hypothetical protein
MNSFHAFPKAGSPFRTSAACPYPPLPEFQLDLFLVPSSERRTAAVRVW